MTARKPPPSLILLANDRVQASYEQFINSRNPIARTQYGSIARRFFGWAESNGLSLDAIDQDHIEAFHKGLLENNGHGVAYGSSRVISNLFEHLAADGVIEQNPARKEVIKSARSAKSLRVALVEDYGDNERDFIDAILVMISPIHIMTFSMQSIIRYTQLPLGFVERIVGRLYEQGIWGEDRSIRCEWLDEHEDPAHVYVALLLDACVALGQFDRRNEDLQYRLPGTQRRSGTEDMARFEIKTTVRETKEVTIREVTQEVVAN